PTPDIEVSVAQSHPDLDRLVAYSRVAEAIALAEATPRRTGSGCVVSSILVLAIVGGAIAAATWAFGSSVEDALDAIGSEGSEPSDEYDIYSFASGTMIPSDTEDGDDLLAIARSADGGRVMYLDFDSEPVTRWTAARNDAEVGADDPVAATDTMVFVAADRFVHAFDRATGTPEYTLGLPDQVAPYCLDCVQVFGGQDPTLVVLTTDGTLSAFRAETGASDWATQLPSDASRQLFSTDGNPTVITGVTGSDGVVQTYHRSTGRPTFAQVPSCEGPAGRVHPVDHVLPTSDDGYVWVGDDGFGACVQRWAPGAESASWSMALQADPATMRADSSEARLVQDRLVVPGAGGFWSMSVVDGSARLVERPGTDEIVPVAPSPGGMIIAEHSDRGSGEWSLVGVPDDPEAAVWQYALAGERLVADRLVIPNQRGWFAEALGEDVVVIEVDDVAGSVSFRIVNGATGAAGPPTTLTTGDDPIDVQAVFGYADGRITFAGDRRVFVADVVTGRLVEQAP
ncbi:MAG: PQQ-binding-like beta-propeller repeat protein, partial [Ilumatobacter sp.]